MLRALRLLPQLPINGKPLQVRPTGDGVACYGAGRRGPPLERSRPGARFGAARPGVDQIKVDDNTRRYLDHEAEFAATAKPVRGGAEGAADRAVGPRGSPSTERRRACRLPGLACVRLRAWWMTLRYWPRPWRRCRSLALRPRKRRAAPTRRTPPNRANCRPALLRRRTLVQPRAVRPPRLMPISAHPVLAPMNPAVVAPYAPAGTAWRPP